MLVALFPCGSPESTGTFCAALLGTRILFGGGGGKL
jgi:hypothetical protein